MMLFLHMKLKLRNSFVSPMERARCDDPSSARRLKSLKLRSIKNQFSFDAFLLPISELIQNQ